MRDYGEIDSKFRFVILAAKRAKQLLKGAKPKIKSKSKNLIVIAQEEMEKGLIEFEIIQQKTEDFHEVEDNIFIGEELIDPKISEVEIPESQEPEKKKKPKTKKSKD